MSAVQLINMLDFFATGSSVYCATNRLKITNDYKKTNRVGQVVSNVSESIKSANDGLIFLLGLRSVGGVS